jgi:hypothetical protein
MIMKDIYNMLDSDASINVLARAATVTGSGVDLQGYQGALAIAVIGSEWVGNAGSYALKLQESADNSTFSDVAAGDILGTQPTLSGQIGRGDILWGYKGSKRYVRAVATHTGDTSTNVTFGVIIVKGLKGHGPTH